MNRLLFIVYIIITIGLIYCNKDQTQKESAEMEFRIDSSLIAQAIFDESLSVEFCPLLSWTEFDSAMLQTIREQTGKNDENHLNIVLHRAFFHPRKQGIITFSRLDGERDTPWDSILITTASTYKKQYPNAKIEQTRFHHQNAWIDQIMLIDTTNVLIKWYIEDSLNIKTHRVQLDIIVPAKEYKNLLDEIESFLGSVRIKHKI